MSSDRLLLPFLPFARRAHPRASNPSLPDPDESQVLTSSSGLCPSLVSARSQPCIPRLRRRAPRELMAGRGPESLEPNSVELIDSSSPPATEARPQRPPPLTSTARTRTQQLPPHTCVLNTSQPRAQPRPPPRRRLSRTSRPRYRTSKSPSVHTTTPPTAPRRARPRPLATHPRTRPRPSAARRRRRRPRWRSSTSNLLPSRE